MCLFIAFNNEKMLHKFSALMRILKPVTKNCKYVQHDHTNSTTQLKERTNERTNEQTKKNSRNEEFYLFIN